MELGRAGRTGAVSCPCLQARCASPQRCKLTGRPSASLRIRRPPSIRTPDMSSQSPPQSPPQAAPPATPAAARPRKSRYRGEGQWAKGHFTPLNANEQAKRDDDGLNVRARIETIYAHRGFDSIDGADLRGRLRWWGLYTQRKPGIDGGKTG